MSEDPDYYKKRRLRRMEAGPEYLEKESRRRRERHLLRLATDPEYRAYIKREKKAYKLRNKERLRKARVRKMATDPEFLERQRAIARRRDKRRDPAKLRARRALQRAVYSDCLVRPDACSSCGDTSSVVHGHHPDYHLVLEVVWLCQRCHALVHK